MKKIIFVLALLFLYSAVYSKSIINQSHDREIASNVMFKNIDVNHSITLNEQMNQFGNRHDFEKTPHAKMEILNVHFKSNDMLQGILGLEILIALFVFLKLIFEYIKSSQPVYNKL